MNNINYLKNMRIIIRKLYYGFVFLLHDKILSYVYNVCLRFILYINRIQYKSIKITNKLPVIRVYGNGKCIIGYNFIINSYSITGWNSNSKIIVTNTGKLSIGNNSGINSTLIYCSNSITIGDNVKIGGCTRIYDTNFHSLDYKLRANPQLDKSDIKTSPIIIEDNVFIGTNCIISKGVKIGRNSIVAAGCVVVKNIPSNEIWGGNPAKFIKSI